MKFMNQMFATLVNHGTEEDQQQDDPHGHQSAEATEDFDKYFSS